jgi:hypothetical protein
MQKKFSRHLVLTVANDDHAKTYNLWDFGKIRIHPTCYWILKLVEILQLVEKTKLLLYEICIIDKIILFMFSLKQLIKIRHFTTIKGNKTLLILLIWLFELREYVFYMTGFLSFLFQKVISRLIDFLLLNDFWGIQIHIYYKSRFEMWIW